MTSPVKQLTLLSAAAALLLSASLAVIADSSSIKIIDPSALGIAQGEIAAIREQMQAAVDGGHVAGALILAGNKDGIGLLESVGTQGPNDNAPIDEQTLFRIYSMTKPIVSVAAMSMVEDGLLRVEDPVGKYIPEFNSLQIIDQATGETRAAGNVMTVEDPRTLR